MIINRVWAMPSKDTLQIKPISDLVMRYMSKSKVSIDPFARNCTIATYTNDMNPNTSATYHMEAVDFLQLLIDDGVSADLVIFDPPYSMAHVKISYDNFGANKFSIKNAQNAGRWTEEKSLINKLLLPNGIFIHMGWHSNGLGKKHNTKIIEILLVAHGGGHNDTIVTVERKLAHQPTML